MAEIKDQFITGKNLYLRGIKKSDLSGSFFQWANDEEVTRYLFMGSVPNILENLEDWFDTIRKSNTDIVFIISEKKSGRPIGFCGLHRIEWISRSAEYRVFIGEKDYWGKSLGQEIAILLIRYAFEKLNMNKVWLGVNSSHAAAVKSYEKSGFVREGILRQEIYRNSKYYDAIRMSILRGEYYKNLKTGWDKDVKNPSEMR